MGSLTIFGGSCPTGLTTAVTVASALIASSLAAASGVETSKGSSGKLHFLDLSSGNTTILGKHANSVTIKAAVGGTYTGGSDGHNSLVGVGTGAVTLFAAGDHNVLTTDGAPSGTDFNLLYAAAAYNDTLTAGAGSTNNIFYAGTGTEVLKSKGSGEQVFYAGTGGQETISGSTVSGATNMFVFNESGTGGGTDVLKNFKLGEGSISGGVTISSIEKMSSTTGSKLTLSDGTTIKLDGVKFSTVSASIVGGNTF